MSQHTILAIDFDGTIAEEGYWPELGPVRKNCQEYLRRLCAEGFYIIIWTCRAGDHVEKIHKYMAEHDLPYDQINEHHPALVIRYGNDTRKIAADLYIDDKNLGGIHEDWETIYHDVITESKLLKKKFLD